VTFPHFSPFPPQDFRRALVCPPKLTEDHMAAPQVTGRKITRQARAPPLLERAAYTIREFCDAHRISKSTYYNLRKQGLGPDEARVRDRVIITMEAAARWRRARERATAA